MKLIYQVLAGCAFFFALSCGGGSSDDGPDPQPQVPDPSAATLVFPDDDTECNEGEVINDTQSRVNFQWNSSENTDSYEVNLRNLETNSSLGPVTSGTNSAMITIDRGVPYEWFVISKATGTNVTATSDTWRFYNQGPGVENYAPFPAEAVSPARGENLTSSGNITLEWTASDVDGDIASYEVFFGVDVDALESLGSSAETMIENVSVMENNTYFWQVVTIDEIGNSSTSEIFEFRVN